MPKNKFECPNDGVCYGDSCLITEAKSVLMLKIGKSGTGVGDGRTVPRNVSGSLTGRQQSTPKDTSVQTHDKEEQK